MYRLFAIAAVLLWVSAMVALFARDVWPAWTAQDPPAMTRDQFARLDQPAQQFGIYRSPDERIGSAWNSVEASGPNTTVYGTVVVEGVSYIPPVRVETVTDFDDQGGLDSFRLDVHGVPLTIKIRGETRGLYFPCELHIGPLHRDANLDRAASRLIGQTLRPFSFLPTLSVGQSWRMQMLDPISAVLTGRTDFTPVVARVTGKETIEHLGKPIECLVVETSAYAAKAWADGNGQVLVQQVEMPGVGRITVRTEPFDEEQRSAARKRIR